MAKTPKLKVQFTQGLSAQVQKLIADQTQRAMPNDNAQRITTTISNSMSSLVVKINGDNVVKQEFGTFRTSARPWIKTMQRQLSPALLHVLPHHLKIKK